MGLSVDGDKGHNISSASCAATAFIALRSTSRDFKCAAPRAQFCTAGAQRKHSAHCWGLSPEPTTRPQTTPNTACMGQRSATFLLLVTWLDDAVLSFAGACVACTSCWVTPIMEHRGPSQQLKQICAP